MKPRKLYEQILIIVLLIIASPFIIGFVLIFVVLYIINFPFEGIIYFKSNYFKDLNEKYYLFITRSNSFKRYKKIKKQEPNRLIFLDSKFELKEEKWFIDDIELIEYINNNYDQNVEYVIVTNRKNFELNDLKKAKNDQTFIIYES